MTYGVPANEAEHVEQLRRLNAAEPYGKPRRVWVDDGHVFVEGHDGIVVSMTPEVAIELSRMIGQAGADSLVNRVMEQRGEKARHLKPEAG